MAVQLKNNAVTTLAADITSSATSISVSDGSVFPTLSGSDYTYATFEDTNSNREIVKVTAISSNTLTVVRAQDNTTARAFSDGDKCELRITAALLNDIATQADTDTNTEYTAGSGITLTGTVFSNAAPDQTVALTGAGTTTISGTYPNFTITGATSSTSIDTMTGDGTTTALTLSSAPDTENQTAVYIDGVYQSKSNYSVSGTTLTFSTAPPSGSAVEVVLDATVSIGTPSDGTVTSAKLSGDLTTPGDLDVAGDLLVGVTNAGATGLSISNGSNLSFSEGSNLSYANIFRQASSAATVIGSGYKYSSTANKMASSHSSAWARTAISAGYGAIKFFTDAAATVAVGTDIIPTEKMRVTSAGVSINTTLATELLNVANTAGNGAGAEFAGNGNTIGTSSAFYGQGSGSDAYVWNRANSTVLLGTNNTERVRITADGIVRKHGHPAFNAYNPAVTASGNVIICGQTRLNQGNHFSTTTGAFTAPVDGVYHFTFAILVAASGSPDYHRILFEINASGTSTSYGDTLEEQAGSSYSSAVMSITIYLNQNDYIRIRNQGAATYGTSYGSFSGHLVG